MQNGTYAYTVSVPKVGAGRRCIQRLRQSDNGDIGQLLYRPVKIYGAVIDLAVDICSATYGGVCKKPDISTREAIASGFAVGGAACGSTTTTLLLAYSGSYIALLMVFMTQDTPVEFILNYKFAAAEMIHTVVGLFGLVTVAPLTAITSGILFTNKNLKLPAGKFLFGMKKTPAQQK